ncbi:hypothetical protein CH373_06695 [Leptospira perolatii]|uniref:Uncharacterized protein n=1 Tax=Leptospira perolatii TaxID=2023191 RepID=A0A2M9ZPE6_9LEPT|nr:hypothetical protein [Leptospira perolatii]PJZ70627.1 hypothetical protein CH360_03555 [Leptospira perolatii]PJZ73839.1 hypothetical protein CH373_06695 [Leptospira perolatii]
MNQIKIKLKVFLTALILLLSYCILDRFLLPAVLFGFPNELEWDTSPWFNFLEKRRKIKFREEQNGVLVVGSSVALYSVLPQKLNEVFASKFGKEKVLAEFYAHPAMTPSDFYYYKEDAVSKNPKLVFYILNPADLQLDYVIEKKGRVDFDEASLLKDSISGRHQNRFLYPDAFFWDHLGSIWKLGSSHFYSLLSKSLFLLSRYRSFLYDPFDVWIEHHFRSGRSYHYYTGIPPKQGIYLRGWAKPEFDIECVVQDGKFKQSIFTQKKETRVQIFSEKKDTLYFDQIFPKSGWTNIEFDVKENSNFVKLHFVATPSVTSDEVDARIFGVSENYGIRLSQNFCRATILKNISYDRILGIDDSRISGFSDQKYTEDYERRLYRNPENESALTRLKVLRKSKMLLSKSSDFFPNSELEKLRKAVEYLQKSGIHVVIVNSPENPIERSLYEKSKWYLGYLNHLQSLVKEKGTFIDAGSLSNEKRDFLDPHHLTYQAAERMSEIYFAEWIGKELNLKTK